MTWTTQPRSKFGQLNAIVSGTGKQLVLIHGVGLRAEAWSEQTSELSKLHKTVAIDIPGHGECSIPTDDFSLKDASAGQSQPPHAATDLGSAPPLLASIADDVMALQADYLKQMRTITECTAAIARVRDSKKVAHGGSGGGSYTLRRKKQSLKYMYQSKRLTVVHYQVLIYLSILHLLCWATSFSNHLTRSTLLH